jgi:hypothetical protein
MANYDAFLSHSHAKDKPIAGMLQSVVQKRQMSPINLTNASAARSPSSVRAASMSSLA